MMSQLSRLSRHLVKLKFAKDKQQFRSTSSKQTGSCDICLTQ